MLKLGLSPPSNSDPVQRNQCKQPGDVGSISERGKSAIVTAKAKSFLFYNRNILQRLIFFDYCHQKSVFTTIAQ
jgi:hypothetical protein